MPEGGYDKLIVNMVDSDHDMRETVVRVTGPWEVELKSERGTTLTTWNLSPPARGSVTFCGCRGKAAKADDCQF